MNQLHAALDPNVEITLLADCGFGDQKLYQLLSLFGWDYVVRFRGIILVENAEGEARPAGEWVSPDERAFMICGANATQDKATVPAVVLVHAHAMKEPRCLASTGRSSSPSTSTAPSRSTGKERSGIGSYSIGTTTGPSAS